MSTRDGERSCPPLVECVTPGEPRPAPIRWHVATVRDARAESPTARTFVLDGVFDLAALEDLAIGTAHRYLRRQPELSGFPISIPDLIKVGPAVFADLMKDEPDRL